MLLPAVTRITGQNCIILNSVVAYEGDIVMCEPNCFVNLSQGKDAVLHVSFSKYVTIDS
jgi:hypothetical protein